MKTWATGLVGSTRRIELSTWYADRGDSGSPGPRRFRIDPLASTKTTPLESGKAVEEHARAVHDGNATC